MFKRQSKKLLLIIAVIFIQGFYDVFASNLSTTKREQVAPCRIERPYAHTQLGHLYDRITITQKNYNTSTCLTASFYAQGKQDGKHRAMLLFDSSKKYKPNSLSIHEEQQFFKLSDDFYRAVTPVIDRMAHRVSQAEHNASHAHAQYDLLHNEHLKLQKKYELMLAVALYKK